MSFPRAKIQRFNDVFNDVPSPTKYDPKVGDKVKGGCILKGENKHPATSESGSASCGKTNQTPVFRTPLVPKKHNCLGVTPSSEKSTPAAFKSISIKQEDYELLNHDADTEELNALRTEIKNKDETILDLEKLVQEVNEQLCTYEKKISKLEAYIAELEALKSNLECINSNNENYEQQLKNYEMIIREQEEKLDTLKRAKEEWTMKTEELEKKNCQFEESNLDYERKIISLEGTIEQLQTELENNKKAVAELKHAEEMYKMNYTVSIECLTGKISVLENEIKELEGNKSKNEATIFGLETQVSTLNIAIENLKKEYTEIGNAMKDLKRELKASEIACQQQRDAVILATEQLSDRETEIQKLHNDNEILTSTITRLKLNLEEEKNLFEEKNTELAASYEKILDNLKSEQSCKIDDMNAQIEQLKSELEEQQELNKKIEEGNRIKIEDLQNSLESKIQDLSEEIKMKEDLYTQNLQVLEGAMNDLISKHAEEIHLLQNEYETKLLMQMQEYTEKLNTLQGCIDEKETLLRQTNQKCMHLTSELKADCERKLAEAEQNYKSMIDDLISQHSAELAILKDDNTKLIESMELEWTDKINSKNKEIETLSKRHEEVVEEMKDLLNDIETKSADTKKITAANETLNARLKHLLEEIKLLNVENETKTKDLKEMVSKYQDESLKNSKLSEKLGELDCKVIQLNDDLKCKIAEEYRIYAELRKCKEVNEALHNKKYDLEITIVELKDKINAITAKMNAERVNLEYDVKLLKGELNEVKKQCRKYEIVMTDTWKSLEALGERLIECENEVEKLNSDNSEFQNKLNTVEKERNEFEEKYKSLMQIKAELEESVAKYKSENTDLLNRCADLEVLCADMERNISNLNQVKDDMEQDRKSYENNIKVLHDLVKEQEIQLLETERTTLDQVKSVSKLVTEKLQFFMQFSTDKIRHLTNEIKKLKMENRDLESLVKLKTEEYDNLVTDNEIIKTTSEITMKECEDLKNQCENKSLEIEKLKMELNILNDGKTSIEEKLIENARELEGLQEQYNIANVQLNEKTELANDLMAKIDNGKEIQLALESELEEKSKRISELTNSMVENEVKIKELEEDLVIKEQELTKRDEDIKSCSDAKNELQQKLEHKSLELDNMMRTVEDLRKTVETLEEHDKCDKKLIEDLKREKNNLEDLSKELSSKVSSLETSTYDMENNFTLIAEQNKNLIREKEILQNNVNELQKKNSVIEDEYQMKIEALMRKNGEIEERKDYYKSNCIRLEKLVYELEEEKTSLQKDFDEMHGLLKSRDGKVEELTTQIAELKSLIGPFREQLEQYETERMLIENDREQLRKQHLEQAAKLGHQNHKQKIQHVVKLKVELLQLRKENERLTLELKNAKKLVEKLREETGHHPKRLFIGGKRPSSTPFKGKENNSGL